MSAQPSENPNSFETLYDNPIILKNLISGMGFQSPTPIQIAVARPIIEGKNLFAGARTGSGKTIAFLAPLAQRLLKNEIRNVLVLAPTRELALQIDEEAAKLLEGQKDVIPAALYGGVPLEPQILVIKHHKPRILICTPGRVIDFASEGLLPFGEVDVVVLDEADRMCDMGFAPQVSEILRLCVKFKQMLMFSATLPAELSGMMNQYASDAVQVKVDAADQSNADIKHQVIFSRRREKINKLVEYLKPGSHEGVIFTRTRNGADQVYRDLKRHGHAVGVLHAGFGMDERERTLRAFKEQKIQLLVATDVASRGLDVSHIRYVIQFDFPESLEDYIHRSGRSGRAGRSGTCVLFVEEDHRDQMKAFSELKAKVNFEEIRSGAVKSEVKRPVRSAEKVAPKKPLEKPAEKPVVHQKSSVTEKIKHWIKVLFKG